MLLIIWLDTANRPQSWLSNYFVDFIDRTLEIKHLKINLSDIRRKNFIRTKKKILGSKINIDEKVLKGRVNFFVNEPKLNHLNQ